MATQQMLACGSLPTAPTNPCGDSYVEPGWIELQNASGNVGPHYRCTWCMVRRSSWYSYTDALSPWQNVGRMYFPFPGPPVNAGSGGGDPLWPVAWPPAPPA